MESEQAESEQAESEQGNLSPYPPVEETRQTLTQIEHRLTQAKKRDVRDTETLRAELDEMAVESAGIKATASPELATEIQSVQDKIAAYRQVVEINASFFHSLSSFDSAALEFDATRAFFERFLAEPASSDASAEVRSYREDLTSVSSTLGALATIERWNQFVTSYGESLEKFYVEPEAASAALEFLQANERSLGAPNELQILKARKAEWEYQVASLVPVQRKIILRLEPELSQKYWTYSPSVDRWYYLPSPPRPGVNAYISDEQGGRSTVEIPSSSPVTLTTSSLQTEFLRTLSQRARQIPDSLRSSDVAKWYESWSGFLILLQETDQIDPILQYTIFRDCAKLLASSDYYFARRLNPLLKMLNAPQLAEGTNLDRFRAETPELQRIRQLASSRISFLPKNYLTVDKTTARLDAQTEKFAFVYRQVGWLDRNFAGDWFCRRPDAEPLPSGELYALLPGDSPSDATLRYVKLGESDGRQITINLASATVPRGSIVLCRVSLHESEPVAKRAGVERFFLR